MAKFAGFFTYWAANTVCSFAGQSIPTTKTNWPNMATKRRNIVMPLIKAALMLTPDCLGRIGYADYELSNNNSNIRRMKGRIGLLSRDTASARTTLRGENSVLYEDCPADNRVRLFFAGIPDDATRTRLKGRGFRWIPSLRCWQVSGLLNLSPNQEGKGAAPINRFSKLPS